MTSFLLCHECYSWVQPRHEHCPECTAAIDSHRHDPSLAQLRNTLGDVMVRLGEVRVPRRLLPEYGLLYATTRGLYFLPHLVNETTEMRMHRVGPPMFWLMVALVFWPVRLVLPFIRGKKLKPTRIHTYHPQLLTGSESELLPQLLMDNPGAFFLPNRLIRMMQRRRGRWVVDRVHGAKVVFNPEGDNDMFHERMEALAGSPQWQHLVLER